MGRERDFSTNRSNGYQWVIMETPFDSDTLSDFSDSQGFAGVMNDVTYREELKDLNDQLKVEYWRIVEEHLTERQKQVLKLLATGKTQIDVAKILNVNQSSVTKSVHGNTDYGNKNGKKSKKSYGGANKRIKKLADKDPKIQQILARIAEIKEELEGY
jgi:predicted transcriptional regulator